jgi:hypothetical protein
MYPRHPSINQPTSKTIPRWLDVDSTHRLRALYPNPCDFTIPIQVGDPSLINDPVLSSSPWTMSTNAIGNNYTQVSADAQHITLDPGEPDIPDAYIDCTLEIMGEDHTITNYDGDTHVATVDTPYSATPPDETPYIIRQVKSFFNTNVAIGAVDPLTQTVSSVNLISASPSQTPGLYNSDLFSFAGVGHGVSNSQVVTSYNPQPLYAAYSQPNHEGAFQWCPLTQQGTVFTSQVSGTIKTLTLSVRCMSSSSQSRLMQVRVWTSNGNTLLSSTLLSVTPSTQFQDITYDISSSPPVQLNQQQAYLLTMQDLTAGGNSTGWIEWSGVPSGAPSTSTTVFKVVPKYSLIVAATGGVSEYVYQQPNNTAATQWIQAGGNQAFVFTTPGDTNTVFSGYSGSAVVVAFDGGSTQRTISTSLYRGNLIQSGQVANPPNLSLVYTADTNLDMTNNALTYAPVSVSGSLQVQQEVSLTIAGGSTGAGSSFNIVQSETVSPGNTWSAHSGQTNVWHFQPSSAVLSTGTADYGHYSAGFQTPANLQNNAQEVQVTVSGFVSGTSFTPTLTFQAWWNQPGSYESILSPMTVMTTLGASTDGGATSPYTATFNYNQANSSNVQFSQIVDLIVGYTYDTGVGTSTYSNNSLSWKLFYPGAASGGGVPIQGGTTYTFLWTDVSGGANDTGFIMFLGANAQQASLSGQCNTTVFPWFNFQDVITNAQWFGQSVGDPWALQGMMPDGHELGWWFEADDTLQLLSVTISLLCFQENQGQRYVQARVRQGNADNLSGTVLESLPTLTVISGQAQGTAPVQVTFTFTGQTLLTAGSNYTFTLTDETGDGNSSGGIYVYGQLDDVSAVGWDQGGLTQWPHPWVSAQMSVFAGQLELETASQQVSQDLTGLYTLDTATSLVIPFTIDLGSEGYLSDFSFLGSSFGNRTVQVSLYGPTVSVLLYQGTIVLGDGGASTFSTEGAVVGSSSWLVRPIASQVAQLQVVASVGTYFFALLDVTPTNNSSTSGVYMYGLAGPLPTPAMTLIVPLFTLSYGPPQALSSFVGSFQDSIEFSPKTSDNLSVLRSGGSVVSSTGKQLNVGWFWVHLDWVIIPKQVLAVGIGGLLTNYGTIYITLVNQGAPTALNLIHSNNRTAPPQATFVISPSSWLYSSDPKQFYTVKGHDDTPQLMQLRLDQPLSFTVTLPNGQVMAFDTLDNKSPSPVNPLVQVSASFRLTPV